MSELMIRYSDDGGNTWSQELWFDLGAVGNYLRRIILNRQGSAYQRVYEVKHTGDRSLTLISMHGDVEVGE